METNVIRKQAVFRLKEDLLIKLKEKARKANSSLNSYVEYILQEGLYDEPNLDTLEAIREARSGEFAGTINTKSMEAFIKSCEE